jgi:hypothetical protein
VRVLWSLAREFVLVFASGWVQDIGIATFYLGC